MPGRGRRCRRSARHSRSAQQQPRPTPGTPPGSTRSGGRRAGTSRRAASASSALYSAVGRRQHDGPRPRELRTARRRRRPPRRGGSRCSTTSTTAAASNPASRSSRYMSEPWSNCDPVRFRRPDKPLQLQPAVRGDFQSAYGERPRRRFRANCRSRFSRSRISFPLAAAEVEDARRPARPQRGLSTVPSRCSLQADRLLQASLRGFSFGARHRSVPSSSRLLVFDGQSPEGFAGEVRPCELRGSAGRSLPCAGWPAQPALAFRAVACSISSSPMK